MVPPLVMLSLLHAHRRRKRKNGGVTISEDNRTSTRQGSLQDSSKHTNIYPETLCRICLKEGNLPIFGEKDISDMLNTLADIQVRLDDMFPKYICQSCNTLLEGAILLKVTAQHTDQTLRNSNPSQTLEYNIESKITKPAIKVENMLEFTIENMEEDSDAQNDSNNDFEDNLCYFTNEKMLQDSNCESKSEIFKLKEHEQASHPKVDKCFYECHHCKLVFKSQERLDKHNRLGHSQYNLHNCTSCDMEFKTLHEYRKHRLSDEHANARKTCPYCNKMYRTSYFKIHLRTHTEGHIFMCDVCGNRYATLGQINLHRETHFLKRLPFKCTLCPYKGRFNSSLKSHMRNMHSNAKPYECPECHQSFTALSNMKRHQRNHKTVRDFQCDQCLRGYHSKIDLERHYKVDHNGIKEFICTLCGKAFGYRKQLRKHEVKFHKVEKVKQPGRTPLYRILETQQQLEGLPSNDLPDYRVQD